MTMKNLELLELEHKTVSDTFSDVEVFTQTSDSLYFIHNNTLHKHEINNNKTTELCPQNFEGATSVKFLAFENKICIVTQNNVCIFDPDGSVELQTYKFEQPIAAASWNLTEEIIAIVFENGDVATYNFDYENGQIFSQGQSSVNAKIPDTVYVGWGSKETQFRGSEGKLKKSEPVEAKPVDDARPTISWRGNGEMFVVNYWVDNKRAFVVFETPCKALYRSEECPGLQQLIAWRPTGNMIATLAITDRESIVIFEKNGQKRFSFDLDFGTVTVRDLKWSPCAQILTIHTETPATDSQNIHLLTASNYKWYSKQTLTFRADNPLLYFDWVETTQFTFVLRAVTKKQIVNYTFRTSVCNSSAICAVIDGQTLQLTDFSEAVIPPIMCSKKIINDSPINFVMLKNSDAAIIDSKNHLKIIDIDKAEFIATVNLEEVINDACQFPLTFHHFIFKKQIIYLAAENESGVVFYSINPQKSAAILINSTIDRLRHLIPLSRNEVVEGLKQVEVMVYMNDSSCPNSLRQTVKIVNDKIYNCQLTTNCHFYVNNQKLSDCVNSYTIFGEYLLYTTKENELHCLRLEEEYLEDSSIQNYRRNIEQGATIVAAIPDSPRIVLQLPRGNLETISCRLISIDILDCLLSNRNWEEAMRFIRLEKLNANLLFDLDSKRFLGQIERFIRGAKTVNELSRMCLEFEEVNVLNTLYKNWGKSEEHPDKISAIFEGMFKYFDKIDYAPYITTIMAINLNFFALRYALMYLQDLLRRSFDDPALKKNLIEAINTLKTYGCTQDDLYSESLLLYDLDLARFVASCCQLDPRVYEPQLNSLKNLSEVERRFKINVFCKKPQAAVAYLLRCADSSADEISSFIKSHNVSREAYESCPKNHRHHRTVSLAFGQDLSRRGCHREAGTIFRRAKLLEEALEEFKKCMHWREIINLMNELKVEEKVKLRMIGCMARALAGDRSTVKDAAILYEHYANDFEMAVNVLARNYFLEEAIHVATRHNQREMIAFEVLPMLHRQKTHFGEKLIELFDTYDQYRTRLAQVRQIKVDKFNRTYDDDDRDDLFSDAGSTITKSSRSSRSRSSTASSRNRRKEEKKKQDLRQGGVYEDIALVRALHSTIKEFYGKGEEVRTWCLLALQETDISYQDVKKIHDYYWSVDGKIEEGLKEIWPPHFNAHRQTQDPKELADLENFEHLDVEYRTPPSGRNTWNLNLF